MSRHTGHLHPRWTTLTPSSAPITSSPISPAWAPVQLRLHRREGSAAGASRPPCASIRRPRPCPRLPRDAIQPRRIDQRRRGPPLAGRLRYRGPAAGGVPSPAARLRGCLRDVQAVGALSRPAEARRITMAITLRPARRRPGLGRRGGTALYTGNTAGTRNSRCSSRASSSSSRQNFRPGLGGLLDPRKWTRHPWAPSSWYTSPTRSPSCGCCSWSRLRAAGGGPCAGGGMHPLLRRGLPPDRALDERHACCRAAHLREDRFPHDRGGAAPASASTSSEGLDLDL